MHTGLSCSWGMKWMPPVSVCVTLWLVLQLLQTRPHEAFGWAQNDLWRVVGAGTSQGTLAWRMSIFCLIRSCVSLWSPVLDRGYGMIRLMAFWSGLLEARLWFFVVILCSVRLCSVF